MPAPWMGRPQSRRIRMEVTRLDKRPKLTIVPTPKQHQTTRDGTQGLLDRLANPAPEPGPDWRAFELNGRPFMVDAHGFNSIEGTMNGWTWNSVPACVVARDGEHFPPGTRFFDVEGTPVAWSPLPDGGMRLGAYDPELRFFPMSSVERNGAEVDAAAFERLRAKFQAGSRNDTVDDKSKAPLAPGPNWRAWSYNGRIIWLDPDEFESRELGPDGAWRVSTPACVVARDGEPVMDAGEHFPPGTRFFDVEGVPAAMIPLPDGGMRVSAFDEAEPRWFSMSSLMRNGGEVTEADFDRLRASFQAGR